jgi:hypothetical protein
MKLVAMSCAPLFPTVIATISFTCMRCLNDYAYQHNMQYGDRNDSRAIQSLQIGYVFCLLITIKLDLYMPLTFNNIHAPTTSSNTTRICTASQVMMGKGVTVCSNLSNNHARENPQFHLHLLFSTPCLKHIPTHQNVRRQIIPLNNFVSHQEPNRLHESYDAKSAKFQPYITDISGSCNITWHFMQTT